MNRKALMLERLLADPFLSRLRTRKTSCPNILASLMVIGATDQCPLRSRLLKAHFMRWPEVFHAECPFTSRSAPLHSEYSDFCGG